MDAIATEQFSQVDKIHYLRQFFNSYRKDFKSSGDVPCDQIYVHIERFVEEILSSTLPGFSIKPTRRGSKMIHHLHLGERYFPRVADFVSCITEERSYSPYVALFREVALDLGPNCYSLIRPSLTLSDGTLEAETFNMLVGEIRQRAIAQKTSIKHAQAKKRCFESFVGLAKYVDALFDDVRSRIIVMRLDLSYDARWARQITVEEAQKDLKHLLNNTRHKESLFDDLIGYIWKLEQGKFGGTHFHVLLFFTNDHLQNVSYRAQQIGEYWKSVITKGNGRYYNCHTAENTNRYDEIGLLAIGRVEHSDTQKRNNLLRILAYFCKDTQPIEDKPKRTSRTFGRGTMPKKRETKMGRPRAQKKF